MPLNARELAKIGVKARRVSTRDMITAVVKRMSPQQARERRLASRRNRRSAVVPGQSGTTTTGRMSYRKVGGGWSRVTVAEPDGRVVTFSLRTPKLNEILEGKGLFYDPAYKAYSEWINTTRGGYLYSQRRQVEGMRKAALKKGNLDEAAKLEQILKLSDEKVARFREEWLEAHSDVEIDEYYEYENTTENTPAVVEWD